MSQPTQQHNLAARMARWSGRHRRVAILGWLGLMATLFAFSLVSPMNMIVFETSGPGESGRADKILYEDFERPAEESVLVQSTEFTAQSPQFQAVVGEVVEAVGSLDEVASVQSPYGRGGDRTGVGGPGLCAGAARVRRAAGGRRGQDRRRRRRRSPQSRRRIPTSTSARSARARTRRCWTRSPRT